MSAAAGVVGVVNAGSSSLKFSLFDGDHCLLDGQVDGIGVRPGFRAKDAAGAALSGPGPVLAGPGEPGRGAAAAAALAARPARRTAAGGARAPRRPWRRRRTTGRSG